MQRLPWSEEAAHVDEVAGVRSGGGAARRSAFVVLACAVVVGLAVPLILDVRAAQHTTESPPWGAISGIFSVLLLWVLLLGESLLVRVRPPKVGTGPIATAKETSASLTVFGIQQVLDALLLIAAVAYLALLYDVTPVHLPQVIEDAMRSQFWGVVVNTLILFLGVDLLFYLYHRASHRIELLWANHSVHHSSEEMNIAVTARNSPLDVAGEFVGYGVMALLGFSPIAILLMRTFIFVFQVPIHTRLVSKGPRWYEFVFNSPSHHRVHHGAQAQYLDRNYGGALIIWDRMFGTYVDESEAPRFGLTRNIGTHNPLRIEIAEWQRLWHRVRHGRTLSERLACVFMPPGWSPRAAQEVNGAQGTGT